MSCVVYFVANETRAHVYKALVRTRSCSFQLAHVPTRSHSFQLASPITQKLSMRMHALFPRNLTWAPVSSPRNTRHVPRSPRVFLEQLVAGTNPTQIPPDLCVTFF